ncbi:MULTISPECIES: 2-hydroxyacid dehydrogenase [unclassified Amycolatopsis]|uniref:2-hydroxyacid dehydrogenase n=1 Tax=unclassified Amycolatopsis TaxID=2618356 RepID=UPI001C6A34A1|nr:2-hydroxyacid dehydrogenase [Amycolatopsis sp. DSM 110486]QYN18139.1 hydroxyacid dehydrogenase [Amycolatopsis sp. DSM 110486]
MRILLIGEAADHEDDLRAHLAQPYEVAGLPWAAADSAAFDGELGPDDVVVSLRFSRPEGQAPPFRLLHVPGAGLDRIDFAALAPETAVANVFEHETPIAEFVLARLLEWEIRAAELQASFGADAWPELYAHRVPHGELYGKTLGLVGYGRIGRAIAERAAGFGVEVLAVDDFARGDGIAKVLPTARLAQVQETADYLVLACPLTAETTGLIDAAALARMPAHAVLVNISRAPIVDETALYEALRDNGIGGAILDVWYRYPGSGGEAVAPAAHPLWDLPNAWCTPHSSAWTTQLPRRRYAVIAENINRLAAGEPLRHVVRPPNGTAQGGASHDPHRNT